MNKFQQALDELFLFATQNSDGMQDVTNYTFIDLIIARDSIQELVDKHTKEERELVKAIIKQYDESIISKEKFMELIAQTEKEKK